MRMHLKQVQKRRDELQQRHPDMPFELTYFGPVIGTHLGAGALVWLGFVNQIHSNLYFAFIKKGHHLMLLCLYTKIYGFKY